MKKKIIIITTGLIIVSLLLTIGLAQKPRWGKAKWQRAGMLAKLPDLTEEQQNKIEELRLNFQKEMSPERIKVSKLRLELKELLIADKPDLGKINSQLEDINKQRLKMEKARIKHRLEVRELLTEKQRLIFDQYRPGANDFGWRRGGRPGRRAGMSGFGNPWWSDETTRE